MCVIMLIEKKDDFPKLATLKDAEALNGHGGGISYIKNNKVHWHKGLSAQQIQDIIDSGIQKPAIIHFRIASVGAVDDALNHPFPITKKAELFTSGVTDYGVLFHNGTWHEWKEAGLAQLARSGIPIPSGKWSDSRMMAFLTAVYGTSWLNLMDGQKIALLTTKGIKQYGDNWKVVKGNKCSNDYFDKTYDPKGFGFYKNHHWDNRVMGWVKDKDDTPKNQKILDDDLILEEAKEDYKKREAELNGFDAMDDAVNAIINDVRHDDNIDALAGISEKEIEDDIINAGMDPVEDQKLDAKHYREEYWGEPPYC